MTWFFFFRTFSIKICRNTQEKTELMQMKSTHNKKKMFNIMYNFYSCTHINRHSIFLCSALFSVLSWFLSIKIEKSLRSERDKWIGKKRRNKTTITTAYTHTYTTNTQNLRQMKNIRINSHSLTSAPNAFAFVAAATDIIYENGNVFFFF